jgi:hypothetical protein
MAKTPDKNRTDALADLPESTKRIMERMVKSPPKPHEEDKRGVEEKSNQRPVRGSSEKFDKQDHRPKK